MSQIVRNIVVYLSFVLLGVAIGWFAKKTDVVVKELEQAEQAQVQTQANIQDSLQRDTDLTRRNDEVNQTAVRTVTKVVERVKEITDEKNCSDVALDADTVRLLNEKRSKR